MFIYIYIPLCFQIYLFVQLFTDLFIRYNTRGLIERPILTNSGWRIRDGREHIYEHGDSKRPRCRAATWRAERHDSHVRKRFLEQCSELGSQRFWLYKMIRITKFTKNTKVELWSLYMLFFLEFLMFSNISLNPNFRMYVGMIGLFCTINCYFEYSIRILCICLYMGTYFKDIFRPPKKSNLFDAPQ